MKAVSIVIVNWNGKEHIIPCLSSVVKMKTSNWAVNIIVVDNASIDGSVGAIRKRFPCVTVIELPTNQGFSGGNNVGIQFACTRTCDYIWLLNNDTTVHPSALRELINAFNDKRVGIAGSKIYFSPGREYHNSRYTSAQKGKVLWYAGGRIDWANVYASHRGVDEVDCGQYDTPQDTDFVTGCSMCIRRNVIDRIGLFDERYYLYLEDLDYCMRAKNAGFRLVYAPDSVVWHANAASTAKPGNSLHQYYMTRNRLLFGMTYASTRTKVALFCEAVRQVVSGSVIQKRAVLDYAFGKFGNRFVWKYAKQAVSVSRRTDRNR